MKYDLAIIGAGAAGIACAKNAVKYKLKTVLFDLNRNTFGGTCLNQGCIPTKFFLNSSKTGQNWQHVSLQKNEIIEKIKKASLNYLENCGIKIIWENASFIDAHTLKAGNEKIEAKNIIIASGSKPMALFTHSRCMFAEDFFKRDLLEEKFLIVGAGYIGIEFACLLNAFKKQVILIEKEENILPGFAPGLSHRLRIILEKKGIKIETSSDAKKYNFDDFDKVILSVGREPNIQSLDAEEVGLFFSKGGWIQVDAHLRTNIENIYACGDVNGEKLLAYVAEHQARVCLESIMGKNSKIDYNGIADCVFSLPQIAKVGTSDEEAKNKNIKYKILKTNFLKYSASYAYNDTDGFMQVIVGQDDRIIGAAIISNFAAELIHIFSFAIKNNLTLKSFQDCIFIHPTLSEIIPQLLQEAD